MKSDEPLAFPEESASQLSLSKLNQHATDLIQHSCLVVTYMYMYY